VSAEIRLQAFLDAESQLSPAELLEYYDTLAAIETEFMLGDWDGGVLATGHDVERQMTSVRWVGKTFHERNNVDPMIVSNAEGRREASPMLGQATLRMVEFRGVVTATMIYDKHPIFDHFRKITDDLVMGIMDRKRDDALLFFYLRRRKESRP
jgi:hypothetical protein